MRNKPIIVSIGVLPTAVRSLRCGRKSEKPDIALIGPGIAVSLGGIVKTSDSKLKRILIIVLGHLLVCFGTIEAIRGGIYYRGFLVPRFGGFLLALLGVGFILYGGFTRLIAKYEGDEVVICAACDTPFYEKDADSGKCPKCGGPITTLKGYYYRRNRRPKT